MKFFKNMQISQRLIFAMGIPFIGLLILGAATVFERYSTLKEMGKVQELAVLGPKISNFVHELQKERGKSAGFISSGGINFAGSLPGQRKTADQKHKEMIEALKKTHFNYFHPKLESRVKDATEALKKLEAVRSQVSSLGITVPQMAKYYTPTIEKLLEIVETTVQLTSDPELVRETQAYVDLLQGKERAGIERAMGAVGFGKGIFPPKIHQRFISLGAQQEIFFRGYMHLASEEEQAYFKKILVGKDVEEVNRMRKIAINGGLQGETQGTTAKYWFKESTARINLLKKVEDHIAEDIVHIAAKKGSAAKTQLMTIMALIALMILGAGYVMARTLKRISHPLKAMTKTMGDLAEGNLDVEIVGKESKDEIGAMARAMDVFLENAQERRRMRDEVNERNSAKIEREKMLRQAIEEFQTTIKRVVTAIDATTGAVANTATELSDMSQNNLNYSGQVSNASSEASQSVQTVASASEEFSASIGEISQQLDRASDIVKKAVSQSQDTNEEVTQLAAAAERIGEVVQLIRDIAEQTNLLALNATIESARAGEMGKGFAVVANEVKALAEQTSKATEEIAAQVQGIQGSTSTTVDSLSNMIETMDQVDQITNAISTSVSEQTKATREITGSIQKASDGTQVVSDSVQHITSSANSASEVAANLQSSSEELREMSQKLEADVSDFLERVAS